MGLLKTDLRLGEILIKKQIITRSLLQQAILKMKQNGKSNMRLHNLLVSDFNVDRHKIFIQIAELYAFRIFNLKNERIDEAQLNIIRGILHNLSENLRDQLIENKVIPFKFHDRNSNVLIFVTIDPINPAIHKLVEHTDIKTFEIAYARQEDIDELISKVIQSRNEFLQLIEETSEHIDDLVPDEEGIDEEALDAEINRSMLTNLIEGTLVEAVRKGASDVHIIPKEDKVTEFYFRIDGKLQLWHRQTNIRPEAVAAVVKDRSQNVDRFDREIAQDGFIQRNIDNSYIRFRVSILPIIGSESRRRWESVVIRILDDRKVITKIDKLGLHHSAMKSFRDAITQPQGMVILTGPTGSGKSTTLVAALNYVTDSTKNVITIEEPVEYLIKEARQIKLSHKLNFDQAIRSILRHDPDIVMVGEMRDLISAKIAITLANTGHLTFSTLHTNDAPSAIARLYMLGVEPFLIANAINLIMAQRLVRTLCNICKKPIKNKNSLLLMQLGFTEEEIESTTFYEAAGCDKCYGGYRGRTAIVEALTVTKAIRNIILQAKDKVDEDAIRQEALRAGMLTIRSSGKERIKEGVTTAEEVLAITTENI